MDTHIDLLPASLAIESAGAVDVPKVYHAAHRVPPRDGGGAPRATQRVRSMPFER